VTDDERIEKLEESYRGLTLAIHDLTMDVRLMAQSMETIKDAIKENGETRNAVAELEKRLIKVESAYGALKLLGTGAALSIIGLAVTAIFGGGG